MARYNPKELVDINAVEQIVLNELQWIFRVQPIADMGIDAHIEMVDDEPAGKLVALQIKTGKGNFHETSEGYTYYGDNVHLDYWIGHSLPVILVAHMPDTQETLWAVVGEKTVERTPKAWKVVISKTRHFGKATLGELTTAFEGTRRQQKLRQLAIHEPLMRHIEHGNKVSVELEDWYNKSLGRTPVKEIVYGEDGHESIALEWFAYFTGMNMKELAEKLFPWSIASVDEEFYEASSEFEHSEHDLLMLATDLDNGVDLQESPEDVHPYADSGGEVASYRLQLGLNEFGRAYLAVAEFLDADD